MNSSDRQAEKDRANLIAADQRKLRVLSRSKLQHEYTLQGAWQTCLNCVSWRPDTEACGKYAQTPPPDVLVAGCEDWIFVDDVPF
jgi:hypothetical protein